MKKKRVLMLGAGAQGTTVCRCLEKEENVGEIICGDYDIKAATQLASGLSKATAKQVNARDMQSIIEAAAGCDLMVVALPLDYGRNVLGAALECKCNYQDFAAMEDLDPDWVKCVEIMLNDYSPKFAANNTLAVIGTGSAPGVICAASRRAVRPLDTCETIYNIVWEGVEAKRFQPFWWSPVTALADFRGEPDKGYGGAYAFENGKLITTRNFTRPIYRQYDYMDRKVRFVEHLHDEPVQMSFHNESHFKGAKNIYFKYGGVGVDFSEPLYKAGLLRDEPVLYNGVEVVPFDFVMNFIPAAPKTPEEVKAILDEGLVADAGAMCVEAYGMKDGRKVCSQVHVMAPGIVESYERAGMTGEQYLTGQGGFLFTKMFVNDIYDQKGLISSDQLSDSEVDYYFDEAAKLGITLDCRLEEVDEFPVDKE
ncbi:MAG: hypothetical protein HFG09_07155 [Oscillibacter sp.]|nr:hypothetical protein [Oscillibacter sp.]